MAHHADDISHDIPPANSDTPRDISRYTVPEAAQFLGISPEAVRNRLSRGTLNSVKENGTVYVLLDADMSRSTGDTPHGTPPDRSRYTTDASDDRSSEDAGIISAKDETIRVLREQLEAEREANRENRRIIAGLVQRVPELEAPRDEQDMPETSSEGTEGVVAAPTKEERRSWLYRFFFGP